jgi:hypothetical protein
MARVTDIRHGAPDRRGQRPAGGSHRTGLAARNRRARFPAARCGRLALRPRPASAAAAMPRLRWPQPRATAAWLGRSDFEHRDRRSTKTASECGADGGGAVSSQAQRPNSLSNRCFTGVRQTPAADGVVSSSAGEAVLPRCSTERSPSHAVVSRGALPPRQTRRAESTGPLSRRQRRRCDHGRKDAIRAGWAIYWPPGQELNLAHRMTLGNCPCLRPSTRGMSIAHVPPPGFPLYNSLIARTANEEIYVRDAVLRRKHRADTH